MLGAVAEIGFGFLFLAGAIFNATYTSTHGEEFYGSFADGAFLPPARWLIEKVVIPRAAIVTGVLVVFQASIATLIFLRGDLVQPALLAGSAFATVAAAASSPLGAVSNLALAAVLLLLAVTH